MEDELLRTAKELSDYLGCPNLPVVEMLTTTELGETKTVTLCITWDDGSSVWLDMPCDTQTADATLLWSLLARYR